MKCLPLLIAVFSFQSFTSHAQDVLRYDLDCRETYIDGMLPTLFTLHESIPVRVITQVDIDNGSAYPSELGTIGGKVETRIGEFKVTATVLDEEPWLQIDFPDGTVLFNQVNGKQASSLGALPKLGKSGHQVSCRIIRK